MDQPTTSLSQLLRESYLAEARARHRHGESADSDSTPSRRFLYGSLKNRAEDSGTQEDSQFPDLSAFLSQEELDKSVNLARQAIGHESHQNERSEVKPSQTSSSPPAASAMPSPTIKAPVEKTETVPQAQSFTPNRQPSIEKTDTLPPQAQSFTPNRQPSIEKTETLPQAQSFTPNRQPPFEKTESFTPNKQPTLQNAVSHDGVIGNNRAPREPQAPDFRRPVRNTPYGNEAQSKKEFLNKAADFIEELSSLFKANSSKRVRPRSCKPHRSRLGNKGQPDGQATYGLNVVEERERPVHSYDADATEALCDEELPQQEQEEVDMAEMMELELEQETFVPPGCAPAGEPEREPEPEAELDPAVEAVAEAEGVTYAEADTNATAGAGAETGPGAGAEAEVDVMMAETVAVENPALLEAQASDEPPYEPPHFIQKLKSREVPEGSKVRLDCIVRGLPVPEVR